jgi:hypothetical protein
MVRRAALVACSLVPFLVSSLVPARLTAQQQSVTLGGFVDTYLAWDSGRPFNLDRAYTSQAARHAEFNVNLAYIDAVMSGDRVRGRLALQAGTSVQAVYMSEPSVGRYSGSSLAQHIQEAVVGVRMRQGVWLDGGVFFSHLGSESWVSRDNPTYTRSLIADYSPYYEAGVKLTWDVRPDVTALLTVVNGWGHISENNADKSVGARIDWALTPHITLGYYNLIGNEQPDTSASRLRFFNGITARFTSDELTLVTTVDGGREARPGLSPASWIGTAVVARLHMTERTSVSGRFEAFNDPDQVLIRTGSGAFSVFGGSFGFDMDPSDGVQWRTEVRALKGKNEVFPDRGTENGRSRSNMVFVTSLAITF